MKRPEVKYKTGQMIPLLRGKIKIMGFNSGYYMLRYVGAYPFVKAAKELEQFIQDNRIPTPPQP